MLKNLKLGIKIGGGFSLVLILLVIMIGIGYNALQKSSTGFTQYREMARDANLMGNLQSNMLMVRMNVKDYIITGSDKDRQEYNEYVQTIHQLIDTAIENIQNPERVAKINAVVNALTEYEKGFSKVVEYKTQRNNAVNNILNVQGPFMEKTFTEIMDSAFNDKDTVAAHHTGLAMKHLLLARLYVLKFLESNEQSAIDRVDEEFNKMQEQISTLDQELITRRDVSCFQLLSQRKKNIHPLSTK